MTSEPQKTRTTSHFVAIMTARSKFNHLGCFNTMLCREKEPIKSWFRSDRFFTIENRWYFITREGQNVGPFESINHARSGVKLFLTSVQKDQYSNSYAESIAQGGQWARTRFQ